MIVVIAFVEVKFDLLQQFSGKITSKLSIKRVISFDGLNIELSPDIFVYMLFHKLVLNSVSQFAVKPALLVSIEIITDNPIRFDAQKRQITRPIYLDGSPLVHNSEAHLLIA